MRLHFTGVNTNKLHDELIAAGIVPQLVESLDNDTWITVDDSQEAAVNAVVVVHEPIPLSQPPTQEEQINDLGTQLFDLQTQLLTKGLL